MHSQLEIRTNAGVCKAELFAGGERPVLLFHDGIGMRPAMHELAQTIAHAGYRVLMPDLFYRMAPYDAPDPKALFTDQAVMAAWWTKAQGNTQAMILDDVPFYIAALQGQSDRTLGVTGYCMGGRLALTAAGMYPDKFYACAAYHPGRLVTDAADSPHQVFGNITATTYIGAATDDATFPVEHQEIVKAAIKANLTFEVYPAKHGWVPTDTPVHDAACARKHLDTLLDLLGR
jgi:carboxymethylenebutenolidase